jgi:hypothetical protein
MFRQHKEENVSEASRKKIFRRHKEEREQAASSKQQQARIFLLRKNFKIPQLIRRRLSAAMAENILVIKANLDKLQLAPSVDPDVEDVLENDIEDIDIWIWMKFDFLKYFNFENLSFNVKFACF